MDPFHKHVTMVIISLATILVGMADTTILLKSLLMCSKELYGEQVIHVSSTVDDYKKDLRH